MSAYLIVEVTYKDHQWTEAYRRDVPQIIDAHGGRYLAKSPVAELIEGDGPVPQTVALLEFPTIEAAKTMLACPEYRPYADARKIGARTRILAIEGLGA